MTVFAFTRSSSSTRLSASCTSIFSTFFVWCVISAASRLMNALFACTSFALDRGEENDVVIATECSSCIPLSFSVSSFFCREICDNSFVVCFF
jgi:hypothetical protein